MVAWVSGLEGPRTRGGFVSAAGGLFRDEAENRQAGRVVEVADVMADRAMIPIIDAGNF